MNFGGFVRKSAFRNRFRTILTIAGMAIAVLAFLFLRTVVDVWRRTGLDPNAQVAVEIEADAFLELLLQRLARLG